MKGKNMILLSVAVIAIGLFVLPQTMAMFVGQHTWFTVRTAEGQYEMCEKCHVNEVAEWRASQTAGGAHSTYASTPGYGGCFCHQINETKLKAFKLDANNTNVTDFGFEHWNESGDIVNASTWNWRSVDTPHAATIVDCVDCHWNESQQINNPNSAHYEFWNQTASQKNGTGNTDDNTVCMACHTHTHLNITWIRLEGFTIEANHSDANATAYGAWDITVGVNATPHKSRVIYSGAGDAAYSIWNNDTQTWEPYTTYSVTISTPAGQSETNGTSAHYSLVVKNTGTVADTYTMSIDSTDNPDISALNPSAGTQVDIAPGATYGVGLEIMDATTGTYNVTVTVTSLNATTTTTATTGAIMTTFSPSP